MYENRNNTWLICELQIKPVSKTYSACFFLVHHGSFCLERMHCKSLKQLLTASTFFNEAKKLVIFFTTKCHRGSSHFSLKLKVYNQFHNFTKIKRTLHYCLGKKMSNVNSLAKYTLQIHSGLCTFLKVCWWQERLFWKHLFFFH